MHNETRGYEETQPDCPAGYDGGDCGPHHKRGARRPTGRPLPHCARNWRWSHMLLSLLHITSVHSSEVTGSFFNITEYDGSLQLHHLTDVHESIIDGNLVFQLELTKEYSFVHQLQAKFKSDFLQFETELNVSPLTESIVVANSQLNFLTEKTTSALELLTRQLPRYHPGSSDYDQRGTAVHDSKLQRQKRALGFFSLGLGIWNAVHLAVLDGVVGTLGTDVANTMSRVNQISGIVGTNSKAIAKLAIAQDKILNSVAITNRYLKATISSNALLSAIEEAKNQMTTILRGLESLLSNRLPLDLMNIVDVNDAFNQYRDQLARQGLEPIILSSLQLFQAEASFVIVKNSTDPESLILSILVPVPLQRPHDILKAIYKPEHTVLRVNETLWAYRPSNLLIAGGSGALAEVPEDYLEKCRPGPQGRICPAVPTLATEDTCLAAVYRGGQLQSCHEDLHVLDQEEPYIHQMQDGSFLLFSPFERSAHIDCVGLGAHRNGHFSHALKGLQRLTIASGCTVRVGSYAGVHFNNPSIHLSKHRSLLNYTRLISMLQVDTRVLDASYHDIKDAISANAHLVEETKMNLRKVTALLSSPLHRTSSKIAPYVLMAITAVILTIVVTMMIVCCCLRRRHNARQARKGQKRRNIIKGLATLDAELDKLEAPAVPVRGGRRRMK